MRHVPPVLRCHWQFSLRSAFVVMAVAGVILGLLHQARRQSLAVSALERSNPAANVAYDFEVDGLGRRHLGDRWRLGEWLRKLFGVDFVASVAAVELEYATDDDLACVARLPQLRRLTLVRSLDVTDEGLKHVGRLNQLRRLELHEADWVTDAGVTELARLTHLESLWLEVRGDRVSDQAVERLRRALPRCRITINAEAVRSRGNVAAHRPAVPTT